MVVIKKPLVYNQKEVTLCLYINNLIWRRINNKTKKEQGIPAMYINFQILNIETHGSL